MLFDLGNTQCVQRYGQNKTEELIKVVLFIAGWIMLRLRRSKRVKCSILQGEYAAIPVFFM